MQISFKRFGYTLFYPTVIVSMLGDPAVQMKLSCDSCRSQNTLMHHNKYVRIELKLKKTAKFE